MEPEENEQVVAEALRGASGLRRLAASESAQALRDKLLPGGESATLFDRDGFFRSTPGALETDGFFAAVISRT
jgi:16S rRNA C967 or C1407 C5-methylase (RsmB/RsmF family)